MLSLAIRRTPRRMAVFSFACRRFNTDGTCLGSLERCTRFAEDYSRRALFGIALNSRCYQGFFKVRIVLLILRSMTLTQMDSHPLVFT